MHLVKMNLAAYERESEAGNNTNPPEENHEALKEGYESFRNDFESAKKAFQELDVK